MAAAMVVVLMAAAMVVVLIAAAIIAMAMETVMQIAEV